LAFQNATIQRDGPRQDEFGTSLLVVEGQASGDSAAYGLVRFDLSDIKTQFDRRFGPGGWSVDSVDLVLSQADPFFNAYDGEVEVFFTGDDKVEISQPANALAYPFAGDFPDAESILTYAFMPLGDGQRDTHTLFDAAGATTPGGSSLMNDILADTTVTLALAESDRAVAAYYAGIAHADFAGPTLRIAASGATVPFKQATRIKISTLTSWTWSRCKLRPST